MTSPQTGAKLALVEQPPVQLTPHERLELLCDAGSLRTLRSEVSSAKMAAKARAGDGVVGAAGRIDGRPVFCYAQDVRYAGGSLGEAHAETIVRVLRLAGNARVPVIGFIESGGARMQEGVAALAGYGRIFHENVALSGKVPQISVITGPSAGGGSYSPALTDFVVMTESAHMFLTGPVVVREALGEDIRTDELGGPRVHERNGVCSFVTKTDSDALSLVRNLLSYLPQHAGGSVPRAPTIEANGDPGALVPGDARKVYDVRDVVRAFVDGGQLLEVAPKWARNIFTGFARLEGRSVGVIANQPRYLGGVMDSDCAEKGARFVRTCNAFGIPLIVLVDTPGFMPGSKQESIGVIRRGAELLQAFAAATVPRVTIVLRKAFGGAYIAMNSRDLGADMTFAWPTAEIGIMSARSAVGISHRRELAAAADPVDLRERLTRQYAEDHLSAAAAARDGFVDELIDPHETRARLGWALDALADLPAHARQSEATSRPRSMSIR